MHGIPVPNNTVTQFWEVKYDHSLEDLEQIQWK